MSAAPQPAPGLEGRVSEAFHRAREEQAAWAARPLRERLAVLSRAREALGSEPLRLAEKLELPWRAGVAESLAVEVAPLLDAMKELERSAARTLRPRRPGRSGRPLWYSGVTAEVRRRPHGVVLVVGPSNYPLMLPGIQAMQALAAGNAVVLKPGAGGAAALQALADALIVAGLPVGLLALLDESLESATAAVDAGPDFVVLTGAHETGRSVLRRLAETVTPSVMELSGADACFVLDDADLELCARSLRFGLELNGGASCIAPRRGFVARARLPELERLLAEELRAGPQRPAVPAVASRACELIDDALERGAKILAGRRPDDGLIAPVVLTDVSRDARLAREEHFAPLLALLAVDGEDDALAADAACPEALGASVFSRDEERAASFAGRVKSGVVTVNDCIAPTGDPRLPFGGAGASGFGTTRGPEGLLALTAPQVVTVTRGRRRHLDRFGAGADALLSALIRLAHGSGGKLAALSDLMRAGRRYRPGDSDADGRQ